MECGVFDWVLKVYEISTKETKDSMKRDLIIKVV